MVADIDSLPSYEALSYVWGVDPPTISMLCNGIPIAIRPNLSHALKRLRLEQTARVFWADALCINQDDNEEKNCQVPLMGRIYSQAERVSVWLGYDEEKLISEVLRYVTLVAQSCREFARENNVDTDDKGWCFRVREFSIGVNTTPTPLLERGLSTLYSRPWFSRLWCVQEIVLAKDALVLWGEQEVPWDDVGLAATYIYIKEISPSLRDDETRFYKATRAEYAAYKYAFDLSDFSFLETLMSFRDCHSTDPRDKVYGLLGIADLKSEVGDPFKPDYGKSVGQVFADAAVYIIRVTGSLDIFSSIGHPAAYNGDDGYTSWAPRWDKYSCTGRLYAPISPPNACRRRPIRLLDAQDVAKGQLCCMGVTYDKVSAVDDLRDYELPTKPVRDHACLKIHQKVSYSEQSMQSLARTMTIGFTNQWGDLEQADVEAQSTFYRGFSEFISWLHAPVEQNNESCALHTYRTAVSAASARRRIFWTSGGSYGLGPGCMRVGDIVAVLYGGNVPYVLRPRGNGYLLLGKAYVDEIMHGELVKEVEEGKREEQVFCLI